MNIRILALQLGLIKSAQKNVEFRAPALSDYKDMSQADYDQSKKVYDSLSDTQKKLYWVNDADIARDANRYNMTLNRFKRLGGQKVRPPAPVPQATPAPAAPAEPARVIGGLPMPPAVGRTVPSIPGPTTGQPMGPKPGVINVNPPPGAGPKVNLPKVEPMRQPYSSSAITEPVNVGYINEAQISSAERNRLLQEAEAKRKYYEVSGNTEALNQRYPFRGAWDTISGSINQDLRRQLEEAQANRAAQN